MRNKLVIAVAMMAAGFVQWSHAQELTLGSKAPKLAVKSFVKGDPVEKFEKGKIYVVEFWAIYEERVVKCWMQKIISPGWRFSSPSASVGASPRPAVLLATLVDDSLSLR